MALASVEGHAREARLAEPRPGATLLERVALALTSTLELEDVLRLLAHVGLDATGAGGTAVLLLEGNVLRPAAVVRQVETDDLQARFHGMTPVELDPMRYSLLASGHVLVLEDAREHEVIPAQWVELFSLRGVALVPLLAEGEPCGLMVVDWDEVRVFSPNDISLLQAMAAYAGIAVRNARQYATMRQRARVQSVLAHSAARLAAPVAPETIAARLADSYVELLGARMCIVALLDPEWREITTVATRGVRPLAAPIAFRDVPSAVVDHLIERLSFETRPVELDDHGWFSGVLGGRDAGVSSYMAMPVVLGDYARGVVLLGFESRVALGDDESSAAEVLAGIAAAAIERHELVDRLDTEVSRLGALQAVSASLNSSPSLDGVLDVVCSAFESILGTSHCSVNLVGGDDPHLLRTLAHRGIPWFAGRPESVSAVPRREVERLAALWQSKPAPVMYADIDQQLALDPEVVPEAVRSAAVFPLMHHDEVVGVIVCGFPKAGPAAAAALDVGQALADLAASAIDRAGLNDALRVRLRQVEALYRLSDVVAATADLDAAIAELNRLFRPDLDARVGSLSVADRRLREAVGARVPDREEAAAIRAWRAQLAGDGSPSSSSAPPPLRTRPTSGGALVPVVHRRRVHGALRVAISGGDVTPTDEDLLTAIGTGCGEIIHKAALHRDVGERERRLAVASERERIARDLHDSVGQVITGMGMLLTDYLPDAPDDLWRERLQRLVDLAERGSREVRDSIYALLFLDTRRHGLVPSLRELARRFEETTGIRVSVSVRGSVSVGGMKDDVLFRTAHEALMNVERHAGASAVSISLEAREGCVSLSVSDDGVGLPVDVPGVSEGHFGLQSVRQRVDEVGGSLSLSRSADGGVLLDVRVPSSVRS